MENAEDVKQFFENNWQWFVLVIVILFIIIGLIYARRRIRGRRCTSTARLDGKVAVITGCNIGVGKETARDFYKRGARVIMACRSLDKANEAARDIQSTISNGTVVIRHLDLTSFKSIREFAKDIITQETRLDILVNNAGLIGNKQMTVDGYDMVFQTNHLGHFLLTNLLLDKIKASAPSRIVNLSSFVHACNIYHTVLIGSGVMHWNDLNLNEERAYTPIKAYNQSKLANILFTKELAQRLLGTGVHAYALHPGAVRSGFTRTSSDYMPVCLNPVLLAIERVAFRTPEQGAQTSIHCSVCEKTANQTGLYYDDCRVKTPSRQSRDVSSAKKLWEVSAEMVKLDDELIAIENHKNK